MQFNSSNDTIFSKASRTLLLAGGSLFFMASLMGCGQKKTGTTSNDPAPLPEVQVTHVRRGTIQQTVQLNATAVFRRQHVLKSPVSGYVVKSFAEPGRMVKKGEPVFVIETKESRALGNSLDSLNRKLGLSGRITIRAGVSGYMAAISHQTGDFVPEGEPLATLNDRNSMVFILNVPVEWPTIIHNGMQLPVRLPDGRTLSGVVIQTLPSVDQATQNPSGDYPGTKSGHRSRRPYRQSVVGTIGEREHTGASQSSRSGQRNRNELLGDETQRKGNRRESSGENRYSDS